MVAPTLGADSFFSIIPLYWWPCRSCFLLLKNALFLTPIFGSPLTPPRGMCVSAGPPPLPPGAQKDDRPHAVGPRLIAQRWTIPHAPCDSLMQIRKGTPFRPVFSFRPILVKRAM